MIDLNTTFFIQLINFLLLLCILNFVLYRPIRNVLKKRKEHCEQYLHETQNFHTQAQKRLKLYQAELSKARQNSMDLQQECKDRAYLEEQTLLSKANESATTSLQKARQRIATEQNETLLTLQTKTQNYAQIAAQKILNQE